MKLPQDVLDRHFEASLKRGSVIRFLMTDTDDPQIQSRYKYALVVGLLPEASDSFLLLTTSRLEKLVAIRKRIPEGFHQLEAGDYCWTTKPTVVDLRNVRCYPRDELIRKMHDQLLTFEDALREEDMQEIDAKLRVSKTIELKTLRKIVDRIS